MKPANKKIRNQQRKPEKPIPDSEFISLAETSIFSPYSQEYLSLLARKEKIFAKKFGRNWYTTKDAGEEYLKKQGISIIIPKEFFPSYIGKITRPVLTPFYLSKEDISKIEVPGEMEEQKEKEVILKEEKIQIEKPEIEVAKKPEVKKIEENKQRVESFGIVIGENNELGELNNALSQMVQKQISELEKSSLTEVQQTLLAWAKIDFNDKNYSEALIKIWQISNK